MPLTGVPAEWPADPHRWFASVLGCTGAEARVRFHDLPNSARPATTPSTFDARRSTCSRGRLWWRPAAAVCLLIPLWAGRLAAQGPTTPPEPPAEPNWLLTPDPSGPDTPSPPAGEEMPFPSDLPRVDRATVRVIALEAVAGLAVAGELLAVPVISHGTGVVVTGDGVVLTARHVVEEAQVVAIWFPGNPDPVHAEVALLGEDDFALLVLDSLSPDWLPLPAPGEEVVPTTRTRIYAVGYPEDVFETSPATTEGIISRMSERGRYQISAPVNSGNSGGPLVDEDDHLLGIVVTKHRDAEGMAYVLPIRTVADGLQTPEAAEALRAARGRLGNSQTRLAAEVAVVNARWAVADSEEGAGWVRTVAEACTASIRPETTEEMARLRALAANDDTGVAALLYAGYVWNVTVCDLQRNRRSSDSLLEAGVVRTWGDLRPDPALQRAWEAIGLSRLAERHAPAFTERSSFARALFRLEYKLRAVAEGLGIVPPVPTSPSAPPTVAATGDLPLPTGPAGPRSTLVPYPGWVPPPASPPPEPERRREPTTLLVPPSVTGLRLALGPVPSPFPDNEAYADLAFLHHPAHHPLDSEPPMGGIGTSLLAARLGLRLRFGDFHFGFDVAAGEFVRREVLGLNPDGSIDRRFGSFSGFPLVEGHAVLGYRVARRDFEGGRLHHGLTLMVGGAPGTPPIAAFDDGVRSYGGYSHDNATALLEPGYALGIEIRALSLCGYLGLHLAFTPADRTAPEGFAVFAVTAAYRVRPWVAPFVTVRESSRVWSRLGDPVDVLSFEPGVAFLLWRHWKIELAGLLAAGRLGAADAQFGVLFRTGIRWD